jgi:septal ring factor EnvC (AmiA/AmiB activator)
MAYVQTKAGWGVSLLGLPGKWWLWLFCFAFVPLPVACFEIKQLLVRDQHAQQRQAAAEAAHLEQTRRLVLVIGEELQRIGAVIEEGSPLQARLLELQSDVQVCFQEMSSPAASGELKLKAGSLVLRTAGLRLRLQSPEEPDAFVLVQAEALAVAEQVIVEHAGLLQQRRQELELRREQVRQAAEQLACVQVASQQQRERLQGLQSELREVRDQRELLSQQLNERQQLERTVADVRGETDREVELLRLATELLKREILVEGENWILGGRFW